MLPQNVIILEKADYEKIIGLLERMDAIIQRTLTINTKPTDSNNDALLTPKKACEFLDISESLFFELVAAGDIKPFGYVGKVKRYSKADIIKYVQRTQQPAYQLPKQKFR